MEGQILREFETPLFDVDHHIYHKRAGKQNRVLKLYGSAKLHKFKDSKPELRLVVTAEVMAAGSKEGSYKVRVHEKDDCLDIVDAHCTYIIQAQRYIQNKGWGW